MHRRIREALDRRPSYRLVEHDTYGIADRLKDIEYGYFVLRDIHTGKCEVHNILNVGSTYCFTVPYDRLDSRTLEYCRETSTSRNVVALAEKHNAKLDRSREKSRKSDMQARTEYLADMAIYARSKAM